MNQTQEEVILIFLYGLFWFGECLLAAPTSLLVLTGRLDA